VEGKSEAILRKKYPRSGNTMKLLLERRIIIKREMQISMQRHRRNNRSIWCLVQSEKKKMLKQL